MPSIIDLYTSDAGSTVLIVGGIIYLVLIVTYFLSLYWNWKQSKVKETNQILVTEITKIRKLLEK